LTNQDSPLKNSKVVIKQGLTKEEFIANIIHIVPFFRNNMEKICNIWK